MDLNKDTDSTPRLSDQETQGTDSETQATSREPQVKTPDQLWAEKLGIPATPPPTPAPTPAQADPPKPQTPYPGPQAPNPSPQAGSRQFQTSDNESQAPASYLIWSIVMTLFCCFIPGIIAIVFSSQVSSRWYAGDAEGAEKASRRAQIWIIVSFVLGLISNTIAIPLMMAG